MIFRRTITLLFVIFLAACAPSTPPLPAATRQPSPTVSPSATALPSQPAAATPTASPVAVETAAPSATPGAPEAASSFPSINLMRWFGSATAWATVGQTNYRLVRTEDGGQTWRDVMPAPRAYIDSPFSDVFFLDASTAWMALTVGSNGVTTRMLYRTTDGGRTWQSWPAQFQAAAMTFFDAQNGWAATSSPCPDPCAINLYQTHDGGQTWALAQAVTNPLGKKLGPGQIQQNAQVAFQNMTTLWVRENPDSLYVSRDTGKTWQQKQPKASGPGGPALGITGGGRLFSVRSALGMQMSSLPYFVNDREGYLYTWRNDELTVYRTSDGGDTWTPAPGRLTGQQSASAGQFVTDKDWFFACAAAVCATHDGGQTWEALPYPAANVTDASTNDTQFVDAQTGYAIVYLPENKGDYTLFHTADGGKTWQPMQPRLVGEIAPTLAPYPTAPVANLPAATPTPQPTIVVTPGAFPLVNQFQFLDPQTGFASIWPKFDPNGTPVPGTFRLLRSLDGGHTWQNVNLPFKTMGSLTGVLSADDFWIVVHASEVPMEGKDTLYHTRDGGRTWKKIIAPFSAGDIQMFDEKHGWVLSSYGGCGAGTCWAQLYSTDDGGLTWTLYHPQPPLQTADTWPEGTIGFRNGIGFRFQSFDTLWMGGGGFGDFGGPELRVSRDHGQTWHEVRFTLPEDLTISHINLPTFINEKEGFISIAAAPGPDPYNSDRFVEAIFATSDGGQTWTPRPMLGFGSFHGSVQFVTLTDWFIDCNGALCATHDGGQTWQALPLPAVPGSWVFALNGMVDAQNGFAAARFATPDNQDYQELYDTHDGGQTWTKLNPALK